MVRYCSDLVSFSGDFRGFHLVFPNIDSSYFTGQGHNVGLTPTFKYINFSCACGDWKNVCRPSEPIVSHTLASILFIWLCRPSEPIMSHTLASILFVIWLLSYQSSGRRECDDTEGLHVSMSTVISSTINVLLLPFSHCTVT